MSTLTQEQQDEINKARGFLGQLDAIGEFLESDFDRDEVFEIHDSCATIAAFLRTKMSLIRRENEDFD
jgi:hypothetical protein